MREGMAVLLLGPMRAGKTTIASYLSENHGFRKYACADKLKQLHHTATGSLEKDREWLQNVGASARVVFGDDFWAQRLVEQLSKDNPQRFVVDDVRYENELRILYNYAKSTCERVVVVLVHVPMDVAVTRGAEIHLLDHESEKYAHTLLNNADYNSDTGVGWTRALSMNIPIVEGALPFREFYQEVEHIMDFEEYERLRVPFTEVNFISVSSDTLEEADLEDTT